MMRVPADSPAVAQGLGLFETMLVERGTVVLLEEHLARMIRSASSLGLPAPDASAFRNAAREAAAAVREEAAVRCLWIALGADDWALEAHVVPIPPRTRTRRTHGRAITLEASLARALPEHKLTSYAPCAIGLRRAAAAGADEGLFVTREGLVLEGTTTNVFAVTAESLITARDGVLPGVMRAWVMESARALGIPIEERCPTRGELLAGSFLTGSLTLLAPIRELDGARCAAPGAIFEALRERWPARPATPIGQASP